jgi:glutamate-5-semialdehyde dehydrogenase
MRSFYFIKLKCYIKRKEMSMDNRRIAKAAKNASSEVAAADTEVKNAVLLTMADKLAKNKSKIFKANNADMKKAEEKGLGKNLVDRLKFGESKIESRIASLKKIAALPDPVGSEFWHREIVQGMKAKRVRVPIGVIMMIYEARPHVSVNAGAFCLKSGNACILKGGSEAKECNTLLGRLWSESLKENGMNKDAIQVISGSHEDINELLRQDDCIDLVIPRGGKKLIKSVSENSKIPVIKHFTGECHVYIDDGADIKKAKDIMIDSKCLMPEVCNAMEVTLVSSGRKNDIPEIVDTFKKCGVKVKGDETVRSLCSDVEPASDSDWTDEHLGMVVTIGVVDGVKGAIEHINRYGSHHTDSIVTQDSDAASEFKKKVDSGVVLVNASTMFCDGDSLGMGAEIGISTDRIHARGPMGLEELTTYKFIIEGDGTTMSNPEDFINES